MKRNPGARGSRPLRVLGAVLVLACFVAPSAWAKEPVEIVVRGVEGEALENVREALAIPPGLVREGILDRRWLERFLRRVPETVRNALEPFGYFEARVDANLETIGEERFRLVVDIAPGVPVRVTDVRVDVTGEGAGAEPLRSLAEKFPLARGDVLRQDLYTEAKGALEARAVDLGYLDAGFTTHVIRVNREMKAAEIDLVLDTGPRYTFGELDLEGAPEYPDRFLRRYQAFRPGDVFTYGRLGETQFNFLSSDRFKEVIVTPRFEAAEDHQVPVTIRLVPSPPKRFRAGIGYGTDTGARFSLLYRDLNVLDRGHEYEARADIAERKQTGALGYIIPSYRNINSYTAFRTAIEHEDIDAFERQTIIAEVERVRAFRIGRQGSLFLRLFYEEFTIGGVDSQSFMLLPGARFARRGYPEVVRPRRGYLYSLEVRGTHQAIGSDVGLVQFIGAGSTLFSLPARFSIFTRLQAGTTVKNEPLAEIPPSLRFFAGGDQSVRGYAFQSLGPTDAEGRVIGGEHLLVGSVEVERAIRGNWGVAVFYDAGNAFNSLSDIEVFQGVGIGARYYSIVGPIKVDVARQIDVDDPAFRLHISLGLGF
jgi:translocation and assembly module TamA